MLMIIVAISDKVDTILVVKNQTGRNCTVHDHKCPKYEKAAAQAMASGFVNVKPEPQAVQSPLDGLMRLGLFRLGLGWLAALSRAVSLTRLTSKSYSESIRPS